MDDGAITGARENFGKLLGVHMMRTDKVESGKAFISDIEGPTIENRAALGKNLEMALDITGQYEKKMVITGRPTGFTDDVTDWVKNPKLHQTWEGYVKG